MAVVEDIHWAEPALLDILNDLGVRVQGSVLFLCPARPDLDRSPSRPGAAAVGASPRLPRSAAEPDETSRLVSLLLEVEDLPPDAA